MKVSYVTRRGGKAYEIHPDDLEALAQEETQLVTRDPVTNIYTLGRSGSLRELMALHALARTPIA